jgi:CheY-like chemotaxis protein
MEPARKAESASVSPPRLENSGRQSLLDRTADADHTAVNSRVILLVEDNEDDVFIFMRAYKHAELPHPVRIARDGQQAYDYLMGEGMYVDRTENPLPFLVLLDLKLPLKPGLELLQAIQAQPDLAPVCVIVLTSSAEARDILRAHEFGARAFLVKPPTPQMIGVAVDAVRSQIEASSPSIPKIPGDMFEIALNPGSFSPN